MNRYTDLFIDFDDTLYDTRSNAMLALHEVFDLFRLGRYFAVPEQFYTSYWNTNAILWDRYAKEEITRNDLIVERFRRPLSLGKGLEQPSVDFCLKLSDKFLEFCADKPGVVEGAHQLMDYLRKKGYRMHLCSNGFHEVQYRKLRASRLKNYFDTIILSEDAGANKPSKAFFDYAFQMSAALPATTLMIGDNFSTDIRGAINAGMDTLYFNRHPAIPAPEPVTFEVHSLQQIMKVL